MLSMSRAALRNILIMVFSLLSGTWAHAGDRIALVIGNSNYQEIQSLSNPQNDAADVANRLVALGFQLHGDKVHYDLDERSLLRRSLSFARAVQDAEIAFLYFAGHGMQFDGDPHLLPIDVPNDTLQVVKREAVGLNGLLDNIAGRASLTIAVFDACREIPDYKNEIRRVTRGGSNAAWRGLSRPMVQANSTLIAYSGGSGELVKDGDGRNSPYTEILLEHLSAEKISAQQLDVQALFSEVSYQFRVRHDGQRPEVINQGVRPNQFYLASLATADQARVYSAQSGSGQAESLPATNRSMELELWRSVQKSNSLEEYEQFVAFFPDSPFSSLARSRIARLKQQHEPVQPDQKKKQASEKEAKASLDKTDSGMTSSSPYLIRALYEWIIDNNMTPYMQVDGTIDGVEVPQNYLDEQTRIILNISSKSTAKLSLKNHAITFEARFSGKTFNVYVPTNAVLAIYAKENGQGMIFTDKDKAARQ